MIVCSKCGSDDVEIAGWMNPNTGEFQQDLFGELVDEEKGAQWCNHCRKHVELEEKKEKKKS